METMLRIINPHQYSGKRVTNKKLRKANEEHDAFLKSVLTHSGVKPSRTQHRKAVAQPANLSRGAPVSNSIPTGGGFKRSIDDYKWRRETVESVATIQEIERKKLRIAPAYNKGAMQYISDEADPVTLGRKL